MQKGPKIISLILLLITFFFVLGIETAVAEVDEGKTITLNEFSGMSEELFNQTELDPNTGELVSMNNTKGVRQMFGSPDKEITGENNNAVWIFLDRIDNEQGAILSAVFTFNSKGELIITEWPDRKRLNTLYGIPEDQDLSQEKVLIDFSMPSVSKFMGEAVIIRPKEKINILEAAKNFLSFKNWNRGKELQKGEMLEINTVIKTDRGRAVIEFEDGSKFVLRENSTLKVTNGGFILDNGRVYMEYVKLGKNFILQDRRAKYGILGTVVDWQVDEQASIFKVIEGSVDVDNGEVKILTQGQEIVITDNRKEINIIDVQKLSEEWQAFVNQPVEFKYKNIISPQLVILFLLTVLALVLIFKRKFIVGIVIVILSLLVSFLLFNSIKPQKISEVDLKSVSLPAPDTVQENGFVFYQDLERGFSLMHPEYLKPEEMQSGEVAFILVGPTQGKETEFYDGISLSFQLLPLEGQDLENRVKEERDMFMDIYGVEPSKMDPITIDNRQGYIFNDNMAQYIYIPTSEGSYLFVVNMTFDPGNLGYKDVAYKMIESIKIL